jgi:hypothetical protein
VIRWITIFAVLALASCGRSKSGCEVTLVLPTQVSGNKCPYGQVLTGIVTDSPRVIECSQVQVACETATGGAK